MQRSESVSLWAGTLTIYGKPGARGFRAAATSADRAVAWISGHMTATAAAAWNEKAACTSGYCGGLVKRPRRLPVQFGHICSGVSAWTDQQAAKPAARSCGHVGGHIMWPRWRSYQAATAVAWTNGHGSGHISAATAAVWTCGHQGGGI